MLWNLLAKFLAIPSVTQWLIKQAIKTPYTHIRSHDLSTVYMYRFWLFNPYLATAEKVRLTQEGKKIPWSFPISIRLHHIMRPDSDRDLHDHPWNARTIILRGWYHEIREYPSESNLHRKGALYHLPDCDGFLFERKSGQTATLDYNEYHRIVNLPKEGVWTLFITYKYRGTWGFKVDGKKVPYYEYIKEPPVETNR